MSVYLAILRSIVVRSSTHPSTHLSIPPFIRDTASPKASKANKSKAPHPFHRGSKITCNINTRKPRLKICPASYVPDSHELQRGKKRKFQASANEQTSKRARKSKVAVFAKPGIAISTKKTATIMNSLGVFNCLIDRIQMQNPMFPYLPLGCSDKSPHVGVEE